MNTTITSWTRGAWNSSSHFTTLLKWHDNWKLWYKHPFHHEHRTLSHRLIITATYTNNGTTRCVLCMWEHVAGDGCLFGLCHSSFLNRKLNCIVSAKFEAQMLFYFLVVNHLCSPLLSECIAGLLVNLLLTKVDLWEWCCTRRGFSLSSTRFSTFFFPHRSLGGHVLNLLKDARGGEALCCATWRISAWFVKPCLHVVVSGLWQWLQILGCVSSSHIA